MSLPITFWADALVHANYVNNRLYQSGIVGVPYTAWTGKRANVKHLRAFGAHVTVRRSGNRPTKMDPYHYDGRILGFGATERNIVYFDTKTKRDEIARHCAVDEFHYSSPVSQRPHGAQILMEKVFPRTHIPPSDILPSQPLSPSEVTYTDSPQALPIPMDTLPPYPQDARRESEDSNITATAAQLLGEGESQQEIPHLHSSTDVYTEPTVLRIPMNNLPTLGLQTRTDEITNAVYVHGCQEGTKLSRLPRWRSMIKNSVIRSVNNNVIRSNADLIQHITAARCRREIGGDSIRKTSCRKIGK